MRYLLLGLLSLGLAGMTHANNEPTEFEAAKTDLAQRLKVPVEKVSVIKLIEKTWRDGSLGCPMPGMKYKQVLIPGSQLVLAVAGVRYYYHAGGQRDYFLCVLPEIVTSSPAVPESH